MVRFPWPVGVLALIGLLPAGVRGDVVTLTSTQDNTLIELPSIGSQQLSNGSGPSLFVGRTNQAAGTAARRGLLQFDVSSIPTGSVINNVTLTLQVTQGLTNKAQTIGVYSVLSAWGQGTSFTAGGAGDNATTSDATWFYRKYATDTWGTPGGDFTPTALATASIVPNMSSLQWSGAGLVGDVQAWLDTPTGNHGWLLLGDEATSGTARGFGTSENTVTLQPALLIDFTPAAVPEPGSLALLGVMAAGAAGGIWRRRKASAG